MKPENFKLQAELAYQNGDLATAATACQQAIQLNPHQASLYSLLGQVLWDMGKTAAAQRCYEQWRQMPPEIVAINPEAVAYFDKANTLAVQGKLSEAVANYEQALHLEPNYAAAWVNLGIIQRKLGNLDGAIRCYRRACAVNTNLVDAYYSLSNAWAEKGEITKAIACCIQALEIKPDFEPAYSNLQYLLLQQGKINSAFPCALHILPVEVLQEFYPELFQMVDNDDTEGRSIRQYIHNATTIYLKPPKTIDENLHGSFKWRRYIYPSTFIAQLPSGRAWGDAYTAAVITADDKLLSEVARGSAELILTSRKLPHPTHVEGNLAFLSVRGGNTYYHWMADLLPKFELLHLGGIDISTIDYFAVNSADLLYQRQSVELLGIDPKKIIPSSQYPHITAKNLIVPSLPGNQGIMTQWGAEFLRRQFLPVADTNRNFPEKIYISRQSASYRRVVNESEVVDFLGKLGFVCVRMEMMSFAEQVAMFAGAKVIVAPHGAGLTNTVFCEAGTKVIEMFARQSVSINYWLIAELVGIDYYYLLADGLDKYYFQRGEDKPPCNHPLYEDIYVNISRLGDILRLAGVGS
ncbi:MAG TPA: DUF563 domain-containing protein [Oscillatoriaceae cyanobacterium M33_DOE_052]|uniref:DUF563 domain-containing protein n=1 Tax=Planktothricoides sp. SpSt-374 TaxID=2282167 RepID=A0A7C3ZJT9_9CYAN|nr:DUF563 domain-containing protein [Oscillatoriaceae cyanobacterium M33_DOE_052]